jgi:predicted nucleic acid-binding Zn finger protein
MTKGLSFCSCLSCILEVLLGGRKLSCFFVRVIFVCVLSFMFVLSICVLKSKIGGE